MRDRSALRVDVRARWSEAAAMEPPGRMKLVRGGVMLL